MGKYTTIMSLLVATLLWSCAQDEPKPSLNTAPGGGTVTVYKAYSLSSVNADTSVAAIDGRIVFWRGNGGYTLVQVALNNTEEGTTLAARLVAGSQDNAGAMLMALPPIDGATGAFAEGKFVALKGTEMFDALDSYDAHAAITTTGATPKALAAGDIGANASPVAEGK